MGGARSPPLLKDPLVAAVIAGRSHEPFDGLGIGARWNLAGRREDEGRVPRGGVDAAPYLALHGLLAGSLENRGIDVTDGYGSPARHLHEALQLIDVKGRIGLLIEVEGDRGEAALDELLVDGVGRPEARGCAAYLTRVE